MTSHGFNMSLRMYAKDLPLEITPAAFLTDLISPGGRRMSMSWRSLTRTTVRLKFSGSSVGTAMTYSKSIQWLIQCTVVIDLQLVKRGIILVDFF